MILENLINSLQLMTPYNYVASLAYLVVMGVLVYESIQDIKHREVKSFKPIVACYPLVIYVGITRLGFSLELLFSSLILAAFFYVLALKFNKDESVALGGADIVIAPLVSTIYGYNLLFFLIVFTLVLIVTYVKPIKKLIDQACVNKELVTETSVPLIFLMLITHAICILFIY